MFPANAPGLAEWGPAKSNDDRHKAWTAKLPRNRHELWQALVDLPEADRAMLFAHCASRTLNTVRQKHQPRTEGTRYAHQLAHALGFNMVQAGWVPTRRHLPRRVTKASIVAAVTEGKDAASAHIIEHLKKPEMAAEAQRLLQGSGWLPEPLRLPDQAVLANGCPSRGGRGRGWEDLPEFLNQNEEEGADA